VREDVVEGLLVAHAADPVGGQLRGHAQGVLATDGDQRVDAEFGHVLLERLVAPLALAGLGARVAEYGTVLIKYALDGLLVQRLRDAFDGALPAVAEAHELVAVFLGAFADRGTDDRVETGAVTAAGEHANAHASYSLE